jgi:hypothetical protein
MPESWTDYLAMLMTALAAGYAVYEIDRRRRRLHDVWDVLGGEDAELTEGLINMVRRGELQPYTGTALA